MVAARLISVVLILIGTGILGHELLSYAAGANPYHLLVIGEVWYSVSPATLNMLQAGVQRHIAPWLWDDVIANILLLWAWPCCYVLGAAIFFLFARPRKRGGLSRRLG